MAGDIGAYGAMAGVGRSQAATDELAARLQDRQDRMDDSELRRVGQDFEAMFVRQILKVMRKASRIDEEGLFNTEKSTQMYSDIADDHLADHVAESGSFGISDMVYDFLKERQEMIVSPLDMKDQGEFKPVDGERRFPQPGSENIPLPEQFVPLHPDQSPAFMPLHPDTGWQGMNFNPQPGQDFVPLSLQPTIGLDRQERR